MDIKITITDKNGNEAFVTNSKTVDDAIAKLGSFERYGICCQCSEPISTMVNGPHCSIECARAHHQDLLEAHATGN